MYANYYYNWFSIWFDKFVLSMRGKSMSNKSKYKSQLRDSVVVIQEPFKPNVELVKKILEEMGLKIK